MVPTIDHSSAFPRHCCVGLMDALGFLSSLLPIPADGGQGSRAAGPAVAQQTSVQGLAGALPAGGAGAAPGPARHQRRGAGVVEQGQGRALFRAMCNELDSSSSPHAAGRNRQDLAVQADAKKAAAAAEREAQAARAAAAAAAREDEEWMQAQEEELCVLGPQQATAGLHEASSASPCMEDTTLAARARDEGLHARLKKCRRDLEEAERRVSALTFEMREKENARQFLEVQMKEMAAEAVGRDRYMQTMAQIIGEDVHLAFCSWCGIQEAGDLHTDVEGQFRASICSALAGVVQQLEPEPGSPNRLPGAREEAKQKCADVDASCEVERRLDGLERHVEEAAEALQEACHALDDLKTAMSLQDSEILRLKTRIDTQTLDFLRLSAVKGAKEVVTMPPNPIACNDREPHTKLQTNDDFELQFSNGCVVECPLSRSSSAKTEAMVLRAQIDKMLQEKRIESHSLKTGLETLRAELARAISDSESFKFEYQALAYNLVDWSRGQDGRTHKDQPSATPLGTRLAAPFCSSRENLSPAKRLSTESESEQERLGKDLETIGTDCADGESRCTSELPRGRLAPEIVWSIISLLVHSSICR